MSRLPDEDLLRIINLDAKDYREEAIDFARAELQRRDIRQPPTARTVEERERIVHEILNEETDVAITSSSEAIAMSDRMVRILNALKVKGDAGLLGGISDFRADGAHTFALQTMFSPQGHRTWLRYESASESDVIRVQLTHLFGHLDLSRTSDPINFLLETFEQNIPSFRNSGAGLGIKSNPPNYLISLNTTHHFVSRMSDEDITDILSIVLFDLLTGLMFEAADPIVMWQAES